LGKRLGPRVVAAFQELEQLAGDDPLQAPANITRALALGPPGGVGADGVQGIALIVRAGKHLRLVLDDSSGYSPVIPLH
jgi:hypothetical protein